ncbi:MAG: 16S rRNA (guanine(527)-N(7))-methyltransferase RsmG [Actinomycetota bacterium]
MTDVANRLRTGAARALGRPLSETESDLLYKYLELLMKWQKTQRLVGSSDPDWIVDNAIVDSLLFARALPPGISTMCDVGSGAGIPGIPLKAVMPTVDVTLVESRERRASFLASAIRELPLTRCRLINRRIEDVSDELAGRFDAIVMRCAGRPEGLVECTSRLLSPGGVLIASGPPVAGPLTRGEWLEVDGPRGPRRFWIYRTT